ncbi:MAG TPA: LysM peptidoglycan-binding domain-containing protein [Desulfomonilia bacterium]|nr:LysM peptidoglycan-binding domain-containing protein [Desulfomonilia bacterium]
MKRHALIVMGLFLFLSLINPCSAEEIKHTVVKGDTLWDISMKYLKTPWKWPLVWANNQDITNPHLIYPGDIVVITKDGDKTIIKIIPSPERGGTESKMTIYTPQEAAAVKEKTILISPQYSTYIYSPNILTGSGTIIKKLEGGDLISQDDHIVLKVTSEMKPDQAITLVSKIDDITNVNKPAGYLYKAVATAVVQEVQSDIVKAHVTYSLQEAKVGTIVFNDLAPVKPMTLTISEPSLNASVKVMDFYGGIAGSSANDLLFIDAGMNQGLEKGAILNLSKPTKFSGADNKEQVTLFHEYEGLVLVLQVLDNYSMGLLVESKAQIEKGDKVTGRK